MFSCGRRSRHGLQVGSLVFGGQLGPEGPGKGQKPRAAPQSQTRVRQTGGVRGHGQALSCMLGKMLGLQLLLEGRRGRGGWRDHREKMKGEHEIKERHRLKCSGETDSQRKWKEHEGVREGGRERETNNTVKTWICTTAQIGCYKGNAFMTRSQRSDSERAPTRFKATLPQHSLMRTSSKWKSNKLK